MLLSRKANRSCRCVQAMAGRPTQRPFVTQKNSTRWFDVTPTELPYFSAVCYYTGKSMYERLGGTVPMGLIMGANGGTAIEMFMPKHSVAGGRMCCT
jgi:hypothetical protein